MTLSIRAPTNGLDCETLNNISPSSSKRSPRTVSEITVYQLFHSVVKPSNTLIGSVVGGVVGHLVGNPILSGVVGGGIGAAFDFGPEIVDQIPDSLKQTASDISKIGIWTLGTYAAYHFIIPDSLVQSIIAFLPSSISELPSGLESFAQNEAISPRTVEGVCQFALKWFALPLGSTMHSLSKNALSAVGFVNFEKAVTAGIVSEAGIQTIKYLANKLIPAPFKDVMEELSENPSAFFTKITPLASAASAIIFSSQIQENSFFHGTLNKGPAFALIGLALTLNTAYNYFYPSSKDMQPLISSLQKSLTTLKGTITSIAGVTNLAAIHHTKKTEKKLRRDILAFIDGEIAAKKKMLMQPDAESGQLPDEKMKMIINSFILQCLNTKLDEVEVFNEKLEQFAAKKSYPTSNERNEMKAIVKGGTYTGPDGVPVTIGPEDSILGQMTSILKEQEALVTKAISAKNSYRHSNEQGNLNKQLSGIKEALVNIIQINTDWT